MDAAQLSLIATGLVVTGIILTWAWRTLGFLNRVEQRMDHLAKVVEGGMGEMQFLRDSYNWLMGKMGENPPSPIDKK